MEVYSSHQHDEGNTTMPRHLKQVSHSDDYSKLREASKTYGEKGDCAVVAVAIACEVSYDEARKALRKAGRKDRQGTYTYQIRKAVESLGFTWKEWTIKERLALLDSYPRNKGRHPASLTTRHPIRYAETWGQIDQTMMVFTAGHVAAFRDGKLHDWSENRSNRIIEMVRIYKAAF